VKHGTAAGKGLGDALKEEEVMRPREDKLPRPIPFIYCGGKAGVLKQPL